MKKRPSIRAFVIAATLVINVLLVACGVGQVIGPTPMPTSTSIPLPPTLTATPRPTPTESAPEFISLLSWVSKLEVNISEFKTFEDGLSSPILMREFENLRGLFPESKGNLVIMTERGDVGVVNRRTGLIAFGQTVVGENESSCTFLVTKDYSDSLNKSVFQPNTDDYVIYPNLVDNVQKEEILRILGTLIDVWEGKISENKDLANHTPTRPISFIQILGRADAHKDGKIIKEFLRVEDSSEDNIFNRYPEFGDKFFPKYYHTTTNGWTQMYSRVVKRDNGSYLSAHYTDLFLTEYNDVGSYYNYIPDLSSPIVLEPYDNLMREIFFKYYSPKHKSYNLNVPWYNFEQYSLEEYYKRYPLVHVYDNYPPMHELILGYQEFRSQGLSNPELSKVDYYNFYVSQVNLVNISSFTRPP